MRANTSICNALLLGALAVALGGCETYAPSALPHTYITNTQQPYSLSGFRLKTAPLQDAAYSAASQAAFLLKNDTVIYVNGQVALRTNTAVAKETVVQLPPGTHVVRHWRKHKLSSSAQEEALYSRSESKYQ